jgi:predicted  nucleic acid-binding Zn-ribbon protein
VASILDDDLTDYDYLLESKANKAPTGRSAPVTDPAKADLDSAKLEKDQEQMRKRNEQLMQLLLQFENENKLLEKGLGEVNDQIAEFNIKNAAMESTKNGKMLSSKGKEFVIKSPSLEKLLTVSI